MRAPVGLISAPLRLVISNRRFIYQRTLHDLRSRYSRSLIGMGWIVLMPLLFLALYAVVQILIYRVDRPGISKPEFVLMLFSAIMSIFGLTEALMAGASAFTKNKTLLYNAIVTPELAVAQTAVTGFITCFVGIPLAMIASFLMDPSRITLWFAPIIMGFQLLFVMGLVWIVSLLVLIVRDIQFFLRFFALGLLLASPLGYTIDMVPPRLAVIVWLNPMSYFIVPYQSLIVFGEWPRTDMLIIMVVISLLSFSMGYLFFRRIKVAMADYY